MKLLNILLISLFLAASAFGAEYYLDATNGSDSDNGTTEGLAWETVDYAWSQVGPGDTVYMMDGNYGIVELSTTASGVDSWDNKVTFTKLTGHDPIVQSILLNDRSFYIEFNDFKIRPGTAEQIVHGVDADQIRFINLNCRGIWNTDFSDLTERDASGFEALTKGMYFSGGTDETPLNGILVDNCSFLETRYAVVTNMSVGDNIVISNNTCDTFADAEIEIGSTNEGLEGASLIEGNNIHGFYSFFTGVDMVHSSGIGIRTNNITVQNNIVHECGSTAGITLFPDYPNSPTGAADVLIQNNLVYDTFSQYAVRLTDISETGSVIFRNNTVIGSHSNGTAGYYYGVAVLVIPRGYNTLDPNECSGLEIYNNIIVGALHFDGSDAKVGGLREAKEDYNYMYSKLTDDGWQTSSNNSTILVTLGGAYDDTFASGFFVNPNFTNAMHRLELDDGYKLTTGSPAINAGDATNAPTTDLLENSRVDETDMGCYEYGAEIRYLLARLK